MLTSAYIAVFLPEKPMFYKALIDPFKFFFESILGVPG